MINPSAIGWIDKFFIEKKESFKNLDYTPHSLYTNVRATGFIYGHIISINNFTASETKGWLKDEISKVALLNTLHDVYVLNLKQNNPNDFVNKLLIFYDKMSPQTFSFFQKVLPNNTPSLNLEKIIDKRVQTNDDLISKNFSHIITNALLFVDVLAFQQYLINGEIPEKYLKKLEETIINIVSISLKIKTNKSKYDDLLIKLFEASIRYSKFSDTNFQNLESLELEYFNSDLEKKYLIDIAGMALWSDGLIEKNEAYFLHELARIINISDEFVEESITNTNTFITTHIHEIPYFNYSNPVKHFYDQTTKNIEVIISRNKNRLIKEITESKELMVLLAISTKRDLNEKEKKKVKKQLLDVCKSIPSLTIFLLPGGSLILPILIKFIPKFLPSSFNENLDD